jgi:predicted CopG family antitoxin
LEVKRILEKAKDKEEWGTFLLSLYNELRRLKGLEAFENLKKTLSEEDLRSIMESSREFRERFSFR